MLRSLLCGVPSIIMFSKGVEKFYKAVKIGCSQIKAENLILIFLGIVPLRVVWLHHDRA